MHLIYLSPFPLWRGTAQDEWFVEAKSWSGVLEYARLWPGRVTFATPGAKDVVGSMPPPGHIPLPEAAEGAQIVQIPGFDEPQRQIAALKDLHPDLVLTLLHLQAEHLPAKLPTVFTAEFDFAIRRDQVLAGGWSLGALRALAGLVPRERIYRRMVREARSIQCNGPAATRAYAKIAKNAVSFMDHRLTDADVHASDTIAPWDGRRPLRLGFSGRWTRIKGPQYAVSTANILAASIPGVTLTMFGGGEMEGELREMAGPNVTFAGFRDFQTEWKQEVREAIDLMLLPHVQGDPSCTYYESLGSGAPVVGFQNPTLSPLAQRFGIGVAVSRRSPEALARAVQSIVEVPARYQSMRSAGIDLVRRETWEAVNQLRVDHLVACASR